MAAVFSNRSVISGFNLQPDTTYYFAVAAYGEDSGGQTLNSQRSQQAQVKTLTGGTPGGDITNSLGMSFKSLPAGTFTMGSPSNPAEPERSSDETQHQVMLSSFYMQTTEVTQSQWKAVMGNTIAPHFIACGDTCPMEQVSWNDIQTFLTALNGRGDGTYRLPTEAEWEYAARANSTTAFANGGITNTYCSPVDTNLDAMGWYCGNADSKTHPVQGKQANAFGLYDMHGNVWEWVQDWYGTYPTGAVSNPTGPSSGSNRVIRGGSWSNGAQGCRSAGRDSVLPGGRRYYVGFRLVRLP